MANAWGKGRITAWSVRSYDGKPTDRIDPRMIAQLKRLGIPAPTRNPKQAPDSYDLVVAIDNPDSDANALSLERLFPGLRVTRWNVEDPFVEGTEAAYRRVAERLADLVRQLVRETEG